MKTKHVEPVEVLDKKNTDDCEKEANVEYTLVPPDGGYGWVIVVACILQQLFSGPLMPMYGLIFGPKFIAFEATPTQISSAFSVFLVCWNLSTLFVGPIVQLRSERFVSFCASFCVVLGLVLCAFSTSMLHFTLAFGLVLGIAQGLASTNTVLIINKYFKKRVGTAYGIVSMGSGVGSLTLPQIVKLMLGYFRIEYTILIYSGICCLSFIGTILIQPVTMHLKQVVKKTEDTQPFMKKGNENVITTKPNQGVTGGGTGGRTEKERGRFCSLLYNTPFVKVFRMINWRLLLEWRFVVLALGSSVMYNCCLLYISSLSMIAAEKGLTVESTANLLTIKGVVDVVMTLAHGFIGDLGILRRTFTHPRRIVYILLGVLTATNIIGIPFTYDFVSLAGCVTSLSLVSVGLMINGPLIYSESFMSNLPSAFGLSNLCKASLAFVIGPLVGVIREHSEGSAGQLYFLAALMYAAMFTWILVAVFFKQS